MSAALTRPSVSPSGDEVPEPDDLERPVVVRRNAVLAALIGAAASTVAIAYLWRASQTGSVLDWALCAVMAGIAALYLANLVDARTPLLVADHLGVRIRLGNQWRGLPWDAVGQVRIVPRRGLVRDGRLAFSPHSMARALEGLDARGRRAAALNQKMYGAALAVPMGLTTRITGPGSPEALSDSIAALAEGRTDVVVVHPDPVDPGPVSVDPGPVPVDPGPVSVDPGPVSVDPGPVSVDPGPVPLEPGFVRDVLASRVFRRPGRQTDTETAPAEEPESLVVADPMTRPVPATGSAEIDVLEAEEPADVGVIEASDPSPRRISLGGLGTIVSRFARGRSHDVDGDETRLEGDETRLEGDETRLEGDETRLEGDETRLEGDETRLDGDETRVDGEEEVATPAARDSAVPMMRSARRGLRAQITRDEPATVLGNAALLPGEDTFGRRPTLPESDQLRRIGDDYDLPRFDSGRVRPISTLGEPVEPLVIDGFQTEPAYDPVIGPELAAARTRVGLSVDELAERTRIRPHVIESIEVDDFAPCGGDFYARGHLRTLCRVLGKDPVPLLAQFDARYATAPINARRVFEAELATGMTGSMRSTRGGPNWTLLIGVVLALVMTWGVIRLFAAEPPELLQPSTPVLNGSAGVDRDFDQTPAQSAPAPAAKPLKVLLVGAQGDTDVVVRDADRTVVWAGEIVLGEKRLVRATPPVTVRAKDGGAVEVRVNGKSRGPLGEADAPARRTFDRPGSD